MGGAKAFFLLILVCFGLYMLATNGQGLEAALAPSTGSLEARAADRDATAIASKSEGDRLRTQAAEVANAERARAEYARQATGEAYAQQTQEANNATAAVMLQLTREAFAVTVAAGNAQSTSTAEALATAAKVLNEAHDRQATAEMAGVIAFQTEQAQTNREKDLKLRNEQIRMEVYSSTRYWWVVALALLTLIVAVAGFWLLKMKDDVNMRTVPRTLTGEAEGVVMKGRIHNIDRTVTPTIDPKADLLQITSEQQIEITRRDQSVQGVGRLAAGGNVRSARSAAERVNTDPGDQQQPALPETKLLPSTVPWSIMEQWPGGKWALGQGAGGMMITVNPSEESAPHLLFAGTTGSGKTHFGLHPLIAQALADRWQVIILDRSGQGFTTFADHPNTHLVVLNNPAEAIGYLESAYQEIIRRQRFMAQSGAWNWAQVRAADPRTLIVVDEFSNLADDMASGPEREDLWRRARMIAAEGRKTGTLLAIALQDPTARSIDLRIRRNCTGVAYPVRERDSSRVIVGVDGAEKLPKQHFLAAIGGQVVEGVAFDASAEEFRRFLMTHPVQQYPDPAWLKVVNTETSSRQPEEEPRLLEDVRKIEQIWLRGGSKREMALALGVTYAGNYCQRVDRAIEHLKNTATTNADMPDLSDAAVSS